MDQDSNTIASVFLHLEQSLKVLDALLVPATAAADVQRIGVIADSIAKVLAAMKAISAT